MSGDRLAQIEEHARADVAKHLSLELYRPADVLALVEIAKAARESARVQGGPGEIEAWSNLCAALARLDSGATEEQA